MKKYQKPCATIAMYSFAEHVTAASGTILHCTLQSAYTETPAETYDQNSPCHLHSEGKGHYEHIVIAP